MLSIDVIIPSYRLLSEYLLPIVQIDIPIDTQVRFLIIADNPDTEIPIEVQSLVDKEKVVLFRNAQNLGVCKTRNIGIDNAIADWVLFLDDDIVPSKTLLTTYLQGIIESPKEIGFFGDVVFPSPVNSFTNGIRASSMLAFFSVPYKNIARKWVPTANVMVNRKAIGDVRFNEIFAKAGAGEEIDFFLRICKNTGGELKGIKNAQVYHDWWYGGKRTYSRFIRWNTGIALLPAMFPEYGYYTFPNVIESLIFGIPLVLLACFWLHTMVPMVCIFLGILTGELIIEFLHLLKTKGISQSRFALEVALIKALNDWGRIKNQFTKASAIFKRFNLSCDAKNVSSQRFWAGLKFISYILISLALYFLLYPMHM
jgi:glycosyltransferase involved in cell wall biosynthesis